MKVITSGVYFLYRDNKLVYVGESGNVFGRIGEHIREGIKEFDEFEFIELSEIERKSMEAFLIEIIRPEYNLIGGKTIVKTPDEYLIKKPTKKRIRGEDKEYKDCCCDLYNEVEKLVPLSRLVIALNTTTYRLRNALEEMNAPIIVENYNTHFVEKNWLYINFRELYQKIKKAEKEVVYAFQDLGEKNEIDNSKK